VRLHVEIFQEDPWLSQKSGVVREEHGKAGAFPIPMRQEHLGGGPDAEQRLAQPRFGGRDFMSEFLVLRERPNQLQYQRDVRFRRWNDA
jgi:hypothetical protein